MVNISAFSGKTIVKPLREAIGNTGLIWISYFSAAMTVIGLIVVFLWFHSRKLEGEGKTISEIFDGMFKVLTNFRLLFLILIVCQR